MRIGLIDIIFDENFIDIIIGFYQDKKEYYSMLFGFYYYKAKNLEYKYIGINFLWKGYIAFKKENKKWKIIF
jgi:hypothetical protein